VQGYLIEGADSAGNVIQTWNGEVHQQPLPIDEVCVESEYQTLFTGDEMESSAVAKVRVTAIAATGEESPPTEWMNL
jgi:hypothetical protein